MNKSTQRIVILGAGAAGLSAAWKLLRENPALNVTIIERESQPGGLARSLEWKGHTLDLGPHRFFTEIPEIRQFIKTFCEESLSQVKRVSRMYLNGKYIPYPIKPLPTLQALGLKESASFFLSALEILWKGKNNPVSYEEYVIGYYGEKLYRRIFQPFAEKVWGLHANRITAETARVRLRGENIWHALKDGLLSKQETYVDRFLYPLNGIGEIAQKFANEISEMGGRIFYNHRLGSVHLKHHGRISEIEAKGPNYTMRLSCDVLINTIPLPHLIGHIQTQISKDVYSAAASLQYRGVVLLYLEYEEESHIDDTWLYYPEEHVPFSRIYVPGNFIPQKKQAGKTCLCIEFPCDVDSELWKTDAKELASLTDDILLPSGLLHTRSVDALAVRIPEGYPLYEIGYEQHVIKVLGYLRSFGNCITAGRQGLFRHNNMDQALQMGILAAEHILQNENVDLWYDRVSRFNDYRIVD